VGHQAASAINGGLHAWHGDGLSLTRQVPELDSTQVKLQFDRSVIADKEDVLASLDDADAVVWDARSAEEHAGTKVVAARGGHVPGAINLDWLLTMDRNRSLRTRTDIRDVLEDLGITANKKVITHCQTHHRSGLTWLIGQSLGYDIRAYHGSWSEWGNDPDTPIEV
jgi:thiosulfate/3-mercaptopyruvate sulfurtransferase